MECFIDLFSQCKNPFYWTCFYSRWKLSGAIDRNNKTQNSQIYWVGTKKKLNRIRQKRLLFFSFFYSYFDWDLCSFLFLFNKKPMKNQCCTMPSLARREKLKIVTRVSSEFWFVRYIVSSYSVRLYWLIRI